ncbi:MAG: penicillin-binding protein 2 [Chloroflexi bacterium]|jgi:cell division protein FtsI/penicillin-binding protein 2|nr:MAG: penicillin-binding protein 2 [Chloroflexota bacterium]
MAPDPRTVRTDSHGRANFLTLVLILIAGVCVARLGYWQVVARDQLLEAAAAQLRTTVTNEPIRGTITDRTGAVVLATTVLRHRLLSQGTVLSAEDRASTAEALVTSLALNPSSATKVRAVLESGRKWAVLLPALDDAQTDIVRGEIAADRVRGVTLEEVRVRLYPQPGGGVGTTLASHVLGFVNGDGSGQYGLEEYYNEQLAGAASVSTTVRGSDGQLETTQVTAGRTPSNLQLCIDATLQTLVEQEVTTAGIADDAESVSAIVMDPYTGAVISSASWPSYDANNFGVTAARDPSRFINPATTSVYEPGSVMKAITSVAALESGLYTPSTYIQDEAVLTLDNGATKVRNSDLKSKGSMTLTAALAWSRNIIFSKVGLSLGSNAREAAARLYATWLRFGFGGKTGIDIVGESQGLVNDPAERRWREIDVANASFGQGVGTTLIQLAVAYSALVNGGVLVRPRLVESVDGVPIPITIRGTATTPEASAQMVRMTSQVTSSVPFYAKLTRMDGYAYGGKTGTAQIWLKNADGGKGAWDFEHYNFTFVGWVGKTAPEYVIAISIRRGTPVTQRQGAIVNRIESFELFRRVAQDLISVYNIPPAVAAAAGGLTSPTHPGAPEPSAPVMPAVGGDLPTFRSVRRG